MKIKKKYWKLRRKILKTLIPEIIWPRFIKLDSVPIKIRNTPYSFGTKRAIIKGNYELSERKLIENLSLKGEIIFEMGGSIGILTSILSHKIGNNGSIFSIEADDRLVNYSKVWLESLKNVKVISGFAFPVYKIDNIIINEFDKDGGSLGGKVKFETSVHNLTTNSKRYRIFDLKRMEEFSELTPSVLVIDIEGSETIMLDIKPKFPVSIKWIMIELHPTIYGEYTKKKIIESIKEENFFLFNNKSNNFLFRRS